VTNRGNTFTKADNALLKLCTVWIGLIREGHKSYCRFDICTPVLHGIVFVEQKTNAREERLRVHKTVRITHPEWSPNEPLSSCGCIVDQSLRGQQFRRRAGKSITFFQKVVVCRAQSSIFVRAKVTKPCVKVDRRYLAAKHG
jgi:hypothetical protein